MRASLHSTPPPSHLHHHCRVQQWTERERKGAKGWEKDTSCQFKCRGGLVLSRAGVFQDHASPWDPEASHQKCSINSDDGGRKYLLVREINKGIEVSIWFAEITWLNTWDGPQMDPIFLAFKKICYWHNAYKLKPQTRLILLSAHSWCPLSTIPIQAWFRVKLKKKKKEKPLKPFELA